jgi:hypothetical protein
MLSKETKHLLYWQSEWFRRFIRTTYHLFNRKAYYKWKTKQIRGYTANLIVFDDTF